MDRVPEIIETHSATVVLTRDLAYKWKKPVRLDVLDFSSLEAREEACRREATLNRPYAPDVYLGVASVTDDDGRPTEHLVVMRRLPDDRRLSTLVHSGAPVRDGIRAVVQRVVAIHARGEPPPFGSGWGTAEALLARWDENVATLIEHADLGPAPDEIERVRALATEYLQGRRRLFLERARGHVREGHGDLLADDIFLMPDGPRILDRLDFSQELRTVDGLDDVAFLAMDLERLGRPDLGRSALNWYRRFARDDYPASLAHHYIAYRAHVRAKVACIRARQRGSDEAPDARELHALAAEHLERGRIVAVLIGGRPGSGKSTVANALAAAHDAAIFRSDEVRKELVGMNVHERAVSGLHEGIYAPEMRDRTYEELIDRAHHSLAEGTSVILDATWANAALRRRAIAVARAAGAVVVELRCRAPVAVAAQRVAGRTHTHGSDATPAIVGMVGEGDPWPEAIELDTTSPEGFTKGRALAAVERAIRTRAPALPRRNS